MSNRILIPSGRRSKYRPLLRELFWDIDENSLYIWYNNKWILIGGDWKNFVIEARDNLEIFYPVKDDTKHRYPVLRLKDDIDINTMTLGKFSGAPRWKGTVKLGEVKNSTFFPLVKASSASQDLIGGKFLMKISRGDLIEYGVYHAAITGVGRCSTFGSDDQNVKCTLNKVTTKDGSSLLGFKTFSTLRKQTVFEEVTADEHGISSEVNFVIYTQDNITMTSSTGFEARFVRRSDIYSTGNDPLDDKTRCQWYEVQMSDFRAVTGIPLTTGSSLDQFDNSCYVYFDIYVNSAGNAFSIDRVFIATKRASENGSEDEIVSEGRVWCHNPYWTTPNDKHTVDVSDGFTFIPTIFDDSSANTTFTPGEAIKIMYVYMVVPGGTTTVAKTRMIYLPPDKIELWFNGWDVRTDKLESKLNITDDDILSSIVIARD